ncbi:hypothetical protein MKY31_31155 [Bacillus sp. FSL M8-0139]|uniref:hypothetical protein n=1 Tax=Bacillus sp. FSL M8-0139 TaxID=2921613 RepID=UPI0030F61070
MTEIVKIEELNTFLPLASLEALPVEEQKMRLQYGVCVAMEPNQAISISGHCLGT